MPLYDYKCDLCKRLTESIQKSDVQFIRCGKCDFMVAERQLSAPGGIRAHGAQGGMVLSEKERKKVTEPLWHDPVTDRCTSVH